MDEKWPWASDGSMTAKKMLWNLGGNVRTRLEERDTGRGGVQDM